MRLKHQIQDLIDSGKITDLEARQPNTKTNPLPNYNYVPPPNQTMCIESGFTEEEVLASFEQSGPEISLMAMVEEHISQLLAAGVFLVDEKDTYLLQIKKEGIIRDVFMFDAWYSSSEDELEIGEAL